MLRSSTCTVQTRASQRVMEEDINRQREEELQERRGLKTDSSSSHNSRHSKHGEVLQQQISSHKVTVVVSTVDDGAGSSRAEDHLEATEATSKLASEATVVDLM